MKKLMNKAKDFIESKAGEENAKIINFILLGVTCIVAIILLILVASHCWVHDYVATVTEPTCLKNGYTTYVCSRCGETYVDDEVPALGHNLIGHSKKEATCNEDGWNAYDTCSRCDYTTKEIIPALGHDFIDYVSDNNVTCTTDGTKTGKCSRCDATNTVFDIKATGHTPDGEYTITKTATPSSSGTRTQHCSVCGEALNETYTLSDSEVKAWYKNNCKSYSYEEIFRNSSTHYGEYVKFTGEVIQVINSYGSYTLRVNVTRQGSYYTYYTDTIMITIDSSDVEGCTRILEDDIVTFYGKAHGTYSYTSTMGVACEVPLMYAEYAVIN